MNPLLPMSAVTRVAIWLSLLGIILSWFLLLRPSTLGGPAHYILVSGKSMEPTLHGGDLLLVRQQGDYSPGDIVAYRVPEGDPAEGRIVVHRIAGGSPAGGFTLQGDNKQAPDFWRPSQDNIVGKMWFRVPHVAGFVGILRAPLVVAAVAAAVAAFMVLSRGEEKKRPRGVSPAESSDRAHSLRAPPGLTLWLLLILTATLVASLAFTARH